MSGIYKIQSISKPNRFYIGSASNIPERWRRHLTDLLSKLHCNSKLQNHVNKYGVIDLQFSILILCEKEDLIKFEQAFFDSHCPTWNICELAGNTLGYKHTEETRLKMRRKFTEAHKKKLSLVKQGKDPWNKGKKNVYTLTEETKHKISNALKGKPKPAKR